MNLILNRLNTQPIFLIFILSLLSSLIFWLILRINNKTLKYGIILSIFLLFFGPSSIFFCILFLLFSFNISQKYQKHIVFVIFLLIQIYIFLGFFTNPFLSFILISVLVLFWLIKNVKTLSLPELPDLNPLDLFILFTSFFLASLPQSHYDAVNSNLYNAKQYILQNSFLPLKESISSLFPQNASAYYSFFYLFGHERGLIISYLLPIFILIFLIKQLKHHWVFYSLLTAPIIFFESSAGYYDLLIVTLSLVGLLNIASSPLESSLLFGFAAASKYFPAIFLPLSFIKLKHFSLKNIFLFLLLGLGPVTIWAIRTYLVTGSPIFPFAQQYFPTPILWPPGSPLENNPMIQTSMKLIDWIKGGFFYYPVTSFLYTSNFLESPSGFPGIGPIILFPLSIYYLFRKPSIIKVFCFFSLFAIGLITRYYRYVWVFQFIFIFILIKGQKFNKFFWGVITIIIVLTNIRYTQIYYRSFNPNILYLLKPDYYLSANSPNDNPVSFLNKLNLSSKVILDSSNNYWGRFNFNAKTFQCHWYWYTWNQDKLTTKYTDFDYLITSNPPLPTNNICQELVTKAINLQQPIYQDSHYQVYKISK